APSPQIRIDGVAIGSCANFRYLGSNLSTDLFLNRELRARVGKVSVASGRLGKRVWKNCSLKLSTRLYRSVVLSILLYGGETWTLYQQNVRYLIRFCLQYLRRILGIRWADMISNAEILRQVNMNGIEAVLMPNQLSWLGHVRRMGMTIFQSIYFTVK
ncbi:hypothetical protein EG68_11768, partial [Paragonimus skrjabini miyazakii]